MDSKRNVNIHIDKVRGMKNYMCTDTEQKN